MDKKIITIIVMSVVIAGLLFWIFGVGRPNNRDLTARLESSINRVTTIEESTRILRDKNTRDLADLERERILYKDLEQINQRLERNYNTQGRILKSIRSGDSEIDGTILRIEERLIASQGNLIRLQELRNGE